jgi:endonuclease/exonuclease/phosphatase family metal-dependent hydrolase
MLLTTISYNIWDLPLWFVKNRTARIKKVAEYLASSNADIICIQESWDKSNRPMIYEIMTKAGYEYNSAREVPLLVGNSGLLTFSRYPIKKKKFTQFSRLSSAFVEIFTAKGILETVIETPVGEVTVYNLHLHMPSWFLGQKIRLRQLKKALEVLAEHDKPAILAGDFNEDKLWEQKEFTTILSAANFSNPLSVAKGMPPTYRLENEFVDIWINKSDFSYRYDYVFIRNLDSLNLQVKSYEPLYLTPVLSDHDPVRLILSNE